MTAARAVGMTDTERLAAIEALHQARLHGGGRGGFTRARCTECGFPHPCLTVQLVRGEATETETPHD